MIVISFFFGVGWLLFLETLSLAHIIMKHKLQGDIRPQEFPQVIISFLLKIAIKVHYFKSGSYIIIVTALLIQDMLIVHEIYVCFMIRRFMMRGDFIIFQKQIPILILSFPVQFYLSNDRIPQSEILKCSENIIDYKWSDTQWDCLLYRLYR